MEGNTRGRDTSVFAGGLIWFGAAVSVAEIMTGALIAPLGFARGMAAVLLGHLIGGLLMFLAGRIGAVTGKSAMETVRIAFGERGAAFFASLNILQLLGWTAVMIAGAGAASRAIAGFGGVWAWSLATGGLVLLWLLPGVGNLRLLNIFAMAALFALTLAISADVFGDAWGGRAASEAGGLSFGAAVELSVAMPLSWLPLLSDYTRRSRKPLEGNAVSCLAYGLVSCWMYAIGLGAALFTGESDIAAVMLHAGPGAPGLAAVILSTVTTTFLDAHSAGVSGASLSGRVKEKPAAITVCVLGTLLAVLTPISQYENFLYLIGSVFAPMTALLVTDYYILKADRSETRASWRNLLLWAAGFAVYRLMMGFDTPIGSSFPSMAATALLSVVFNRKPPKESSGKKGARGEAPRREGDAEEIADGTMKGQ
jgi:putative hydroxymethylpyrimidine transporter CytX